MPSVEHYDAVECKEQPTENIMMEQCPMSGRGQYRGILCVCLYLVLCRVAREWNRTGDKWAHLPDIGDWLLR